MDQSEGYKPRIAKQICLCPESEGSRAPRAGERDNEEARSRLEQCDISLQNEEAFLHASL